MSDHKEIWLEPNTSGLINRMWAEEDAWQHRTIKATRYIRADLATPTGTIITVDESTWPDDGIEFAWREPIERDLDQRTEITTWNENCQAYISQWIGCTWWPIGDMFQPPEDE